MPARAGVGGIQLEPLDCHSTATRARTPGVFCVRGLLVPGNIHQRLHAINADLLRALHPDCRAQGRALANDARHQAQIRDGGLGGRDPGVGVLADERDGDVHNEAARRQLHLHLPRGDPHQGPPGRRDLVGQRPERAGAPGRQRREVHAGEDQPDDKRGLMRGRWGRW